MNKVTLNKIFKTFKSDEEAVKNGLKTGDLYIVKSNSDPYYLPEGYVKRVMI